MTEGSGAAATLVDEKHYQEHAGIVGSSIIDD